jgi:hypothetical protein
MKMKLSKLNESSDLFTAEWNGKEIKIKSEFLKPGGEDILLEKLKKFNLGSGHESKELSKIDDDNFMFRLETFLGHMPKLYIFKEYLTPTINENKTTK